MQRRKFGDIDPARIGHDKFCAAIFRRMTQHRSEYRVLLKMPVTRFTLPDSDEDGERWFQVLNGVSQLKESIKTHGLLTQDSGVPIRRVILLWSNTDPVTIRRDHYDYATGKRRKLDEPSSLRFYDSQNNHHIEIRVAKNKKGDEVWSGEVVTAFEAAQRKLAKLRAFRDAGILAAPRGFSTMTPP